MMSSAATYVQKTCDFFTINRADLNMDHKDLRG